MYYDNIHRVYVLFLIIFSIALLFSFDDVIATSNITSTKQDDYNLVSNSEPVYYLGIVQAVGALATAGALIFVGLQYLHTRQEKEITLRPWLGVNEELRFNEKKDRADVNLQNYGKTPGKIEYLKQITDEERFTSADFKSDKFKASNGYMSENHNKIILFPTAKNRISMRVNGLNTRWVGILAEYTYSKNKKGKFLIIWKYHEEDSSFYIQEVSYE